MSTFTLPNEATAGFAAADKYDAHRPSYPPTAVKKFLSALNLDGQPGAKIVEVGAGTGKFTELIAVMSEGFEIVAVDPHEGMRKGLEVKVEKEGWGHVKVVGGDAEHLPVEDGWADCALATQAFHWFATESALREIHRVLPPGAALGMIWNIEDYNSPQSWPCTTKWEQKLNDMIWSLDDGLPRFRHLKWKEVFEKQLDTTPLQTLKDTFKHELPIFSLPLGEEEEKFSVYLSEEALWDRYATLSQVAVLKGKEREDFKKKFDEAVRGEDVVKNEKGELEVHGKTYFAWTSRV